MKTVPLYLALSVGVIGVVGLLWVLLWPLSTWLAGDLGQLSTKERIDAVGAARAQLSTILSAALVAGGLYYSGRKFILDRDKQVTDRFNGAVDHLRAPDETVRAGGIRALDRIAEDSPRDRIRVQDTLADFLRQHTREAADNAATCRSDIRAAVAALGRIGAATGQTTDSSPDLRGVRLAGATLRHAGLRGVEMTGANLTAALLAAADLSHGRFEAANLKRATAPGARLRHAYLFNADLAEIDLTGADCHGADFTNADLKGAILDRTVLTDAVLTGTDVRGTDLSRARGVTATQLRAARVDNNTRMPDGIDHPLTLTDRPSGTPRVHLAAQRSTDRPQ